MGARSAHHLIDPAPDPKYAETIKEVVQRAGIAKKDRSAKGEAGTNENNSRNNVTNPFAGCTLRG